jgi:hypothetical protein
VNDLEEDTLPSYRDPPRFAIPPPPRLPEDLLAKKIAKLERDFATLRWMGALLSLSMAFVAAVNSCR